MAWRSKSVNEHVFNTLALLYLEARHKSLLFCYMFGTSIPSCESTRLGDALKWSKDLYLTRTMSEHVKI